MIPRSQIKMPDRPTSTTTCVVCGEKIIFYTYVERHGQQDIRPVPQAHNGNCRELYRLNKAHNKLLKYETRTLAQPKSQEGRIRNHVARSR